MPLEGVDSEVRAAPEKKKRRISRKRSADSVREFEFLPLTQFNYSLNFQFDGENLRIRKIQVVKNFGIGGVLNSTTSVY
ncbi:unnamed protein product [Allacma fusca]|uniref:Uncharacterized protein n=1 Tax=Allacma fusca TaxID=39272 RepID=A0A8J2KWJ2_9HEXA|nr:unnamed protein product [Allacma fusca]